MSVDFDIDPEWLTSTLHELVEVDSPVGYYPEIHEWLAETVAEWGYQLEVDNKRCAYVRVEGADPTHTVCVGAHLDTIGLVVRGINDDGTLRIRQLGGINYASIEGETCSIHCRGGRTLAGQVICKSHSVHVFDDARTCPRDENGMLVSVIADVSSEADARALGISEGAVVSIDPHFEAFDNGYIVSRHIDDKAAVAALLDILRWYAQSGERPAYTTLFAFPIYEEIGHGGSWVPEEAEEYVAVDITLIGPDYKSNEHQVGIITSDRKSIYDWDLTNVLISCAEEVCDADKWNTQVCFHYTTDAAAAYTTTNDLRAAAFGMACLNTHGRERCHVDAIVQTEKLARAYLAGMGR